MYRALALVIGMFLLAGQPAQALSRYSVSLITNDTTVKITIAYRWGKGPWISKVVKPAKTAILAFRYVRPGVVLSPPLTMRFATDRKNPRGSQRTYRLEVVACDDKKGGCGRVYHLAFGDEPRYIELHDEE